MKLLKKAWAKAQGRASVGFRDDQVIPDDVGQSDHEIIEFVRPFTMTSPLRVESLLNAVRYCQASNVEGAFVECGVWRGGSVLAMLCELNRLGCGDRDIYLYDTFEGMTEPTSEDTSRYQESASETWRQSVQKGEKPWSQLFDAQVFSEAGVREVLLNTGYAADKLHFVRGPVEETIPETIPEKIALLRLDTDWYESTRHELEHLYPRLVPGGILIIDDYGHWDGCRRAVDEYFARDDVPHVLLQRIDYTGRLAVKCV